jgi:hypothetical protein
MPPALGVWIFSESLGRSFTPLQQKYSLHLRFRRVDRLLDINKRVAHGAENNRCS